MSQLDKERRCTSQANDEDRLSALTDDIILSILGRVQITAATRTSVLSRRWRSLPRLFPVLNLGVWDFLPVPFPETVEAHHMEQAMACLTEATRSFLADPGSKSTNITRLCIQLYVSSSYSREIGPLVCDVIDSVVLKQLDLRIVDAKVPGDCQHERMVQQAQDLIEFFTSHPSVHHCLTRLFLQNVRFAERDIDHLLFHSCKQLKRLLLVHCDVGDCSVWQINAPDSKLSVLEVFMICLERVEVLCLPKLRCLRLDNWFYDEAPLRFGFVPSLQELILRDRNLDHGDFSLSAVLQGTTDVRIVTLDFEGERIWIRPEGTQLCRAFNKLSRLSICGIFVDFDLLWTLNILEAAPSVEMFCVQIRDHSCQEDGQLRTEAAYEDQKAKPSSNMPGFTNSKAWQLKELVFVGFCALDQQILFIRAVMKRASNLKAVILEEDEKPCRYCIAMDTPRPTLRGGFSLRDKEEQEAAAKQLRDGVCSSTRIIFSSNRASAKCAVYS